VGVLHPHLPGDKSVEFANGNSNTAAEMERAELAAIDVSGDLAWRLVKTVRCLFNGQQDWRFTHAVLRPDCD
jgi:hypothetical protein